MEKYQIIERAGSGNFSDVYKAKEIRTGEIVAIKQMKQSQDIEQIAMKQLKILSSINHSNIVNLKQVIMNQGDIKVVFQYIEENLLELYEVSKTGINQNQIKCILYQTAFALSYLHNQKKIIHRDIKPENILIDKKKALVKLIDFGLATQQHLASTDYVATRWYRAPENLIGLKKSTTAIDIFALACVVVQLFTLNAIFPGDNTMDQLNKVFNILGTPTQQNWPLGHQQMKRKGLSCLPKNKISLKQIMMNASDNLIDLLEQMLVLNPQKRIKAIDILLHPFFNGVQKVIPVSIYKQSIKYLNTIQQKQKQQKQIKLNKSLSTGIISNIRYNPHVNEIIKNQSFRQQSWKKIINKSENKIQIPILPFNHNSLHVDNQSRIGYVPQRAQQYQIQNFFLSPQHRDTRLVNYTSREKKYPVQTKRQNEQRYLGIDPVQLQKIKRKIHENEGMMSPRYNVKYFKQSNDYHRQRRNLSVGDVQKNRLILQPNKNNQAQYCMNTNIKNPFSSKMNLRSN